MKLFVYGTLRMGDSRAFFLEDDNESVFINTIKTAPKYKLVNLGSFPALVEGGSQSVVGELWEITDFVKKGLDTIEGVPYLYLDKEIELEDGTKAIAYVMQDKGYPIIESGDWFDL